MTTDGATYLITNGLNGNVYKRCRQCRRDKENAKNLGTTRSVVSR